MLINDVKKDFKHICIDNDMNMTDAAKLTGQSKSYLSQIFNRDLVSPRYVNMLDRLGYDIRLEYLKKK